MNAYGRKNEHRAKTLALSTISGTIVIVVAVVSISNSGIFERPMRMLAPARGFENFEVNTSDEVLSLKDTTQKMQGPVEPDHPQEAAVGVEIEKIKEHQTEEMVPQSPSRGTTISRDSRTRYSRALHHKGWHSGMGSQQVMPAYPFVDYFRFNRVRPTVKRGHRRAG
jgi:hypothetical protein